MTHSSDVKLVNPHFDAPEAYGLHASQPHPEAFVNEQAHVNPFPTAQCNEQENDTKPA